MAILGQIGTGAAYVLNYQIITSEGATVASTVTYLLPVVALILGLLVLGERITLLELVGIALILTGIALIQKRAVGVAVKGSGDLRMPGHTGCWRQARFQWHYGPLRISLRL